jgi:hypothetical protein
VPVQELNCFVHRSTGHLSWRPAHQRLGCSIEIDYPTVTVDADDRIADARQCNSQPLSLGRLPLDAQACVMNRPFIL